VVEDAEVTAEGRKEEAPGGGHPVAETVDECHRCGEAIAPGETRCPECGSRLYRECFCGWRIPVTAARCPHCGADWTGAHRTRKRAHSHKVHAARLGTSAVVGALVALVAAALLGVLIKQLALRALPEGDTLPDSLSARLGLAWDGAVQVTEATGSHLAKVSAGLSTILLVVFLGAVIGTVIYLVREELLRVSWPPWRKRKHSRRRRAR
jgi:predicted RNA-binding Zn-ribbon protein involved in translation (DUF1610 family)